MLLDYPTLRVIWWVLLGTLLIGFAVMDGFDLGIGMLLHYVARNNNERRVTLNTIGPVWEGNQVWLILGVGSIFAAWPTLYAVSFSGFYLAILAVLASLIVRPVGFKFRSKIDSTRWRMLWDIALFIAGFVPALIFGVALGNVLEGVPFHFDPMLRAYYTGTFWGLINPFALLCGLVSIFMLMMHGGVFLSAKTTGIIHDRARSAAILSGVITLILYAFAGFYVGDYMKGYLITSVIPHDGPSNPLYKQVVLIPGGWIQNFIDNPKLIIVQVSAFMGIVFTLILLSLRWIRIAWVTSALSIASIIATVGVSMFPFILPSSSNPNMSLTVWDASSSQLTLFIMLIVTAIFLPLILLYTSWVYRVMRGKVTEDYINQNQNNVY